STIPDLWRRSIVAIELATTLDLLQLPIFLRFDVGRFRRNCSHDVLVQDHLRLRSINNRTDPKLRLTRSAQLAHDNDVERSPQRTGHLVGHRDTAARQSQNNRVVASDRHQCSCKLSAGVAAIAEPSLHTLSIPFRKLATSAPPVNRPRGA